MTHNTTIAETWAKVNHDHSAPTTWWDEQAIAKSSKPTHGKFLIGPNNKDLSIIFINTENGATLSTVNASPVVTITYSSPAEFAKLVAMGKGGAIAVIFLPFLRLYLPRYPCV